MKKIILYNPAISSLNIGDEIIAQACKDFIYGLFPDSMYVEFSTHLPINNKYLERIKGVDYSFVLGSNLLMPKLDARFRQWDIKLWNVDYMKPLILMGVGWNRYADNVTPYTKSLYKRLLIGDCLHSVRDEYTKLKLNDIGIDNVINTGCPSFWGFDEEWCRCIPKSKSDRVVFTLTDYRRDYKRDKQFIEILKRNYREVFFWTQGIDDYEYFKELGISSSVQVVDPSLTAFDRILASGIDYVGTRLHGGIRALKFGCRSVILAVDNRAVELNRDYNLPVINRVDVDRLESMLNSDFATDIRVPFDNISLWRRQFEA